MNLGSGVNVLTKAHAKRSSTALSKKQSHPNELSENSRKGDVCWGERPEKEGHLVKLVGDQNPSPEALPRSRRGQEDGAKEMSREE